MPLTETPDESTGDSIVAQTQGAKKYVAQFIILFKQSLTAAEALKWNGVIALEHITIGLISEILFRKLADFFINFAYQDTKRDTQGNPLPLRPGTALAYWSRVLMTMRVLLGDKIKEPAYSFLADGGSFNKTMRVKIEDALSKKFFALGLDPEEETVAIPLVALCKMELTAVESNDPKEIEKAFLVSASLASCGRASESSTITVNDIKILPVHNTIGLSVDQSKVSETKPFHATNVRDPKDFASDFIFLFGVMFMLGSMRQSLKGSFDLFPWLIRRNVNGIVTNPKAGGKTVNDFIKSFIAPTQSTVANAHHIPELHPNTTSTGIRCSVASLTLFTEGGGLEVMVCLGGWFMESLTTGFRYAKMSPGILACATRIINGYAFPNLLHYPYDLTVITATMTIDQQRVFHNFMIELFQIADLNSEPLTELLLGYLSPLVRSMLATVLAYAFGGPMEEVLGKPAWSNHCVVKQIANTADKFGIPVQRLRVYGRSLCSTFNERNSVRGLATSDPALLKLLQEHEISNAMLKLELEQFKVREEIRVLELKKKEAQHEKKHDQLVNLLNTVLKALSGRHAHTDSRALTPTSSTMLDDPDEDEGEARPMGAFGVAASTALADVVGVRREITDMSLSLSVVLPNGVLCVDDLEFYAGVQLYVLRNFNLPDSFSRDVPDKHVRFRLKQCIKFMLTPSIASTIHRLHLLAMKTDSSTFAEDLKKEKKFLADETGDFLSHLATVEKAHGKNTPTLKTTVSSIAARITKVTSVTNNPTGYLLAINDLEKKVRPLKNAKTVTATAFPPPINKITANTASSSHVSVSPQTALPIVAWAPVSILRRSDRSDLVPLVLKKGTILYIPSLKILSIKEKIQDETGENPDLMTLYSNNKELSESGTLQSENCTCTIEYSMRVSSTSSSTHVRVSDSEDNGHKKRKFLDYFYMGGRQ